MTKIYEQQGGEAASFKMVINEFADMTEDEFLAFATGAAHTDERLDTSSPFFDFETMQEVDNPYVQEYFDDDFMSIENRGTLDLKPSEVIAPYNRYGDLADSIVDNKFEALGKFSLEDANRIINDKKHLIIKNNS